ncbi:MAG: phosphopantetheine-binding protein [Sphingobacterium sp.]
MNIQIEDIVNKINDILVDEFEIDQEVIAVEKNLKDTLDLDSLDYVDLVVIIESNFGVKLVESDFATVVSFQDFYDLIERKILVKQD